ncbi:VirB3 family type IV secretion system protein [Qipengyuania sp. 6B39]|uniref:type IV secretion system protein VirB3 n=1 Tax=Qipengyuania proteolytica TaxID=2867239 RepID=UPI001C8AC6A7|nr:VirB3 family type IV secretion system protein [Qipengyuania proteolytica]MBX7494875.1 VirB3 family type IV secretion system protein [Qipengyuania proteolytica]
MSALERDTVFTGLTRPQLLLGVPFGFVVLNGVLVTELFLVFKAWWVLLVGAAAHLGAWVVTLDDPHRFDQWLVKVRTCPRVPNFRAWRCNSYRP